MILCAHQPSRLLDQRAPSLGVRPLPCVNRRDSLWVCRWGHSTSLVCPCCRGNMGPHLGHAPKLRHPCPNATQVFINLSKASTCMSPWCRTPPSCAQGAPAHTHVFVHPTNLFLSMFSFPTHPKSAQRVCTLCRCCGRPYSLSKDLPILHPNRINLIACVVGLPILCPSRINLLSCVAFGIVKMS